MISINGSKSLVRTCRDIRIISALDPTTALLPLERPLLSTEEHALRYGGHKTLKVTAGLHRAVWVAGTAAYVDVNIINNTNRKVKSIKCKLRRHILAYKNVCPCACVCKSPCVCALERESWGRPLRKVTDSGFSREQICGAPEGP